jgi:hypothetical protein
MSWKGELLKGKAKGASLFLAWSFGVLAVYLLYVAISLLENSLANWLPPHTLLVFSLMLLTMFQGILLLPQFSRRIIWTLLYCLGVATTVYVVDPAHWWTRSFGHIRGELRSDEYSSQGS